METTLAMRISARIEYNKRLNLAKIGVFVKENHKELIIEGIADLSEELMVRTPVKTGRAAMGWSAGLIKAGRSIPDLSSDYLDTESMTLGASESELVETNNGITLQNKVPYIGELEFGSSQQAPSGFIRASIQAARAKLVRRERDLVNRAIRSSGIKSK